VSARARTDAAAALDVRSRKCRTGLVRDAATGHAFLMPASILANPCFAV
jgi:hypothetical protein